ncbi:hypothetical protein [Micromonospora sp. NPDC051006]|uniref:hypothetical protein n=1 Tax=Micromonospora sp. NPDC051006 TaxID=3364283 RepID=UPI0037B38418
MTQILAFIVTYMGFLWSDAHFKIVGSEVTLVNGGDALLVLESPTVRLRFVRDRGQLFLDFQPAVEQGDEWYSVDLVRRLLLGKREYSAVLDESYAQFLASHLREVEERFDESRWEMTRKDLKELKVRRAKEMFG